jgi:NADP-dependent 3-hydroxy acid dehydrogenase YdfG
MSNTFFHNKNIIITGASSGLGLELARQLIGLGANVFGTCHNPDNIQPALDSVDSKRFKLVQCDVADVLDSAFFFDSVGKVDILINNAGVYVEGKSTASNPKTINNIIQTNLVGAINSTNLVLPKMLESNSGIIYFVGSSCAIETKENRSIYAASKAGFKSFAEHTRKDYASTNIQIMELYPQGMQTNLFKNSGKLRPLDKLMPTDKVASLILTTIEYSQWFNVGRVDLNKLSNTTSNQLKSFDEGLEFWNKNKPEFRL